MHLCSTEYSNKKMKVSKMTVRNFLTVFDEMDSEGPSDWGDYISLEGNKQGKSIDDAYTFVNKLKKWSNYDTGV